MGCKCKDKAKKDENTALRAEVARLNRLLMLARKANADLKAKLSAA